MKKYMVKIFFTLALCFLFSFTYSSVVSAVKFASSDEIEIAKVNRNAKKIEIKIKNFVDMELDSNTSRVRVRPGNVKDIEGVSSDYVMIDTTTGTYHFKTSSNYQSINNINFTYDGTDLNLVFNFLSSETDGVKHLLIEILNEDNTVFRSFIVEYDLSSIDEKIVLFPDVNGNATNVIDGVQYTNSWKTITVSVVFDENDYFAYDSTFYVIVNNANNSLNTKPVEGLEIEVKYDVEVGKEKTISFDNMTFGNGEKELKVYFVPRNYAHASKSEKLKNAKVTTKKFYLDSSAPTLNLSVSKYLVINTINDFNVEEIIKNSTCSDKVFSEDECVIEYGGQKLRNRYEPQIVTFKVMDRLGNTRIEQVSVVLAQKEESFNPIVIIAPVAIIGVTAIILIYFVYKNYKKRKEISYI